MKATGHDHDTSARHWLSQGFEELAARCEDQSDPGLPDFDVVIVGSGYGGAMAACHLAGKARDGKPLSIAILERGGEYLNGMFPAGPGDLASNLRWSSPGSGKIHGNRDGLFDVRLGPDVTSIVASGLGGGSLINAGVMLRPRPQVFDEGWPAGISYDSLEDYMATCEELLGARPLPHKLKKFEALERLGNADLVPVTVVTGDYDSHRDDSAICTCCGNCVTGCNFGAKLSLDISLLARAVEHNEKVECFTGTTVSRFWPAKDKDRNTVWCVEAGFTREELASRDPVTVRCRSLIVAAGTFGSTELLIRSQHEEFELSPMLGRRFSMNGDMLAFGYGQNAPVKAISRRPGEFDVTFEIGPTITGCIDRRDECGILLEELAIPYSLHELFEQVLATGNTLHNLAQTSFDRHCDGFGFIDNFSIDEAAMDATAVYALMGDDGAEGEICRPADAKGEGVVYASWPGLSEHRVFRQQLNLLDELVTRGDVGGTVMANPAWQLLPDAFDYLLPGELHGKSASLVTVHPLGGCPMAESGDAGVVDHLGRVFVGRSSEHYTNLCVLDGSVIPRALGVNPALSIAAISLRAIENLAVIWGFKHHDAKDEKARDLPARPDFQIISSTRARRTEIEVHERLVGDILVDTSDGPRHCTLEITLATEPAALSRLHDPKERVLVVSPASRIRLFPAGRYEAINNTGEDDESIEARLERRAIATMEVSGEILLFPRESSTLLGRIGQAIPAWFLNRGLRDIYQAYEARDRPQKFGARLESGASRFKSVLSLASHAGERRTITYRLRIERVRQRRGPSLAAMEGKRILGQKTITYQRASNPLRQMMEMKLEEFPGLHRASNRALVMDPRYLARVGFPLVGVTEQQDLPSTIMAFLGLAGYLLRMLLTIHAFTFRLPDRHTRPPLRRLPGPLAEIPVFEQYKVGQVLLTRYRRPGARPVMMLHGYSASGTTFAHDALAPSFAAYMWQQGWDVWVVDLRSSAGLPSSVEAWTFEGIAGTDIPTAVDHIHEATGGRKIHVVAHCMGAAMFSMAVLSADHPDVQYRMKDRIARVVLTQVGPGVIFSPGNTLRAWVLAHLKRFFPLTRFDFRVEGSGSLLDQLIDRVLNLLPYPEHEFRIENPAWPPWQRTEFVGIRHRMDLLYGRDFSLANVQAGFLKNLDAQFGGLNIDTISQAAEFARWRNITDKRGRNLYFLRKSLQEYWKFDTLSLHGQDNGLSSIGTLLRNKRVFRDAGVPYKTRLVPGFGHQDIWASPDSEALVFREIHEFLSAPGMTRASGADKSSHTDLRPLVAAPPFMGPVLSLNPDRPNEVFVKVGNSPNLSLPLYILVFAVEREGAHYWTSGFNLEDDDFKQCIRIFENPRLDDNGMIDLAIDVPDGCPDLLVLMLHDEHPDLINCSFGEPPLRFDHSLRVYGAGESDARLRDAIVSVLGKQAARLAPAVIRTQLPGRGRHHRRHSKSDVSEAGVVFASCQFPATVVDKQVAWASYQRLATRLEEDRTFAPELLLLLGDQVYVDPTAGLVDPQRDYDRYIKPHIEFLSNDAVQAVVSKVPTYMMLDDHEIRNNWQRNEIDQGNLAQKRKGESAFRSFQFNALGRRHAEGFWGEVSRGPVPAFMLNTRTEREHRTLENLAHARLFTDRQLNAVTAWLDRQVDGPKIVSFSSLPLPRHRPLEQFPLAAIRSDSVDGFPATLEALLLYIAEHRIAHVVFLSGDEHRPITAQVRLMAGAQVVAVIHSIHTTALYSPYPFANAVPADFVTRDRFEIGGGRYTCEVDAEVHFPGEGFTILNFRQDAGRWQLDCLFEGTGEQFRFTL